MKRPPVPTPTNNVFTIPFRRADKAEKELADPKAILLQTTMQQLSAHVPVIQSAQKFLVDLRSGTIPPSASRLFAELAMEKMIAVVTAIPHSKAFALATSSEMQVRALESDLSHFDADRHAAFKDDARYFDTRIHAQNLLKQRRDPEPRYVVVPNTPEKKAHSLVNTLAKVCCTLPERVRLFFLCSSGFLSR